MVGGGGRGGEGVGGGADGEGDGGGPAKEDAGDDLKFMFMVLDKYVLDEGFEGWLKGWCRLG